MNPSSPEHSTLDNSTLDNTILSNSNPDHATLAKATQYSGLHLMANCHQTANSPLLTELEACKALCINAVFTAGLTVVGEFFHCFGEKAGVTGVVVLAESHIAIHTWPESRYVTLDVFVCNHNRDNSSRAKALFESLIIALEASEVKRYEVLRD